jgi:hypothetical protein
MVVKVSRLHHENFAKIRTKRAVVLMRKWLSRLTFSFLIVALACGFEAYQGYADYRPSRAASWNAVLSVASVVSFAMFLAAVRIRHGSDQPLD